MNELTRGFLAGLKREQDEAFERLLRTYNAFQQAQKDYQAAIHRTVEAARAYDEIQQDNARTDDTHGA